MCIFVLLEIKEDIKASYIGFETKKHHLNPPYLSIAKVMKPLWNQWSVCRSTTRPTRRKELPNESLKHGGVALSWEDAERLWLCLSTRCQIMTNSILSRQEQLDQLDCENQLRPASVRPGLTSASQPDQCKPVKKLIKPFCFIAKKK